MGGARRALNRSAACKRQTVSNPSFAKKPFNKFKAKDERNEKKGKEKHSEMDSQPVLKLVELTAEQEDREDVTFIFDKIPENVEQLKAILKTEIKKVNSEDKNEKVVITNLVLQRIRDYYHPLATKKVATDE